MVTIITNLIKQIALPMISDILGNGRAAKKIEREMERRLVDLDIETVKAQAKLLDKELSGSRLQRNWRPHLMYLFMGILGFYAVLVPVTNSWILPLISSMIGMDIPKLDVTKAWQGVPSQLWNLLTVGVGGYVVSRGAAKIFSPTEGGFRERLPVRRRKNVITRRDPNARTRSIDGQASEAQRSPSRRSNNTDTTTLPIRRTPRESNPTNTNIRIDANEPPA